MKRKIFSFLMVVLMLITSSSAARSINASENAVDIAYKVSEEERAVKGPEWKDTDAVDRHNDLAVYVPPQSNVVRPAQGYALGYVHVSIESKDGNIENWLDVNKEAGIKHYGTENVHDWMTTADNAEITYIFYGATVRYTLTNSPNNVPSTFDWDKQRPDDLLPDSQSEVVIAEPYDSVEDVHEGKTGIWTFEWKVEDPDVTLDGNKFVMPSGRDSSNPIEIKGTWTFNPYITTINVTKVWTGDEGYTDERTPVTFYIYENGEEVGEYDLKGEGDTWVRSIELDGAASNFTFSEIKIEGYDTKIDIYPVNTTNTTVTFTNKKIPVEITIKKVWEDNNNPLRPKDATFTIKRAVGGSEVTVKDNIKLNESNGWTWTEEFVGGKAKDYRIYETLPAGYMKEESPETQEYTLTDTFTNTLFNTTNTSITKIWDDNNNRDGNRPENVSITLLANGEEYGIYKVSGSMDTNKWESDLITVPVYDGDGNKVKYTVKEEKVDPNYTSSVNTYNTTTVTNTYTPVNVTVTVTKQWDDDDNRDGKRPENVTFTILANDEELEEKLVVNEGNSWNTSNTSLPKYKDGKKVEYTLKEETPEGYIPEFNKTIVNTTNTSFIYKNTHKAEKINVSVEKKWVDNDDQDGKRPTSITVTLLANGETIGSWDLNESNNWAHTFEGLYKYENGVEIEYTFKEVNVPEGYKSEIKVVNPESGDEELDNDKIEELDNLPTAQYEIINTHTPDPIDIEVEKKWVGDSASDRPATITVNLFADGKLVDTAKITKDTNWKYVFRSLPKNKDGKEIKYTVEEVKVEGYTTKVDGYLITNTIIPKPDKPKYYIPQTGIE